MTKLEALVEHLRSVGTDEEIIEDLIVKYFNNQYSTTFSANNEYEVYTNREYDDLLMEVAENHVSEIYNDLEDYAYSRSDKHVRVMRSIRESVAVEQIFDMLDSRDFEIYFEKTVISDETDYIIVLA